MSSGTRAQRLGTKAVLPSTGKHNKQTDKHSDTPKGQDKVQPTADQMRIAQIMELHLDEPGIRTKVSAMMEMTCRSEDEVCSALHDCDYDMDRAVNSLFENIKPQNEWEMQVKKKKNRVSSTGGGGSIVAEGEEDWDSPSGQTGSGTGTSTSAHTEPQRGSRGRGGVPGGRGLRRGNVDNRGWRGRENNERNTDDGNDRGYRGDRGDGGYRRGGSRSLNGPGGRGGGFGGRGGRGGGRLGQRSYQSRSDNHRGPLRQLEENTVSWDDPEPSSNTDSTYNKEENWDETFPSPEDWDNEEYTGSLADTKVFEPSGKSDYPDDSQEPESQDQNDDGVQQYSATVTSSNYVDQQHMASPDNTISGFVSPNSSGALQGTPDQYSSVAQLPEVHSAPTAAQQLTQALELHANATQNTSSLSAEQSQYFSTLAQQSITASASTIPYSSGTYPSQGYNIGTTYTTMADSVVSTQQPQRKQRARVPPPSKIPATAVEMPADVSSNIGYLDVQFGALEFGSDTSSFDGSVEAKYEASTTQSSSDLSAQQLDGYKTTSNISTSMGQGQIIVSTDSLVHTSENNLGSVSVQNYPSQSRVGISVPASIQSVASSNSTLEQQLSKSEQHSYGPSSAGPALHQAAYQQNSYSAKAQNAYQSPTPYTNNYSSQVTTTSYPPQSVSSYSNNSSYNSTANAYHPSSNVGNSTYVTGAAVQGYQGAFASSIVQQAAANIYPVQNQNSYQSAVTNSAVYGSGTGLNSYSVSNANSNAGSIQYNNYTVGVATTHSLKQPATKEMQSQYDPSQVNNTSTTGSSVSSPASLSNLNTQPASSTTKVTSNSANASKSASIVNNSAVASNSASNMAGVAPVMGAQYIMGQAGVPFYQQPLYSYEDLQLLQQRIPHMQTGYYDMSYQTPTTLSTSRDGSIGSVQYSLSDGRFARADNASPVPSTMSQQTGSQGHAGAPMLNPALPPGYAYFAYGGGMMPGSFQYGTPAIYPQMATTANAHGSTTTNQYPKPSYSGYSSGYDSLSQSQGDYNKGGYPAGAGGAQPQGAKQSAGTNSAPVQSSNNDMTSGMYTKSHAALNKVNSYEKQGFHSGTPPPFSLVGSGGSGLAPYTPHLFVPTMQPPHQQHHSTPLLHQPLHQDSGNRLLQDTGSSSGQRSQSTSQPKSGAKQGYSSSPYWTPN